MLERLKRVRARVPNVALGVIVGLLVGGGAFAVAQTTGGVHGGPNPRFHDPSECNLVDVRALEGNWTHGDYVSAVEKQDPSKVREAAQSRCGKPDKTGKGQKNGQKQGESDGAKEQGGAKPSPKPTKSEKPSPSPEASATGTASPVVPQETQSPTPSPSTESSSATP